MSETKLECSTKTFEILMNALTKAAEDNKIDHLEFIAFVYEFPRLLLGDQYDKIEYRPAKKEKL